MKPRAEHLFVPNAPWFKTWFDSTYYHKLYAHHNDAEAADFINELIAVLQPVTGSVMLDVGCGMGRHCKHLGAKGFNVTGIDLALSSIREAKKYETSTVRFFQHDMRQPYGTNRFDNIFNFFTSFGYFKTEQEHYKILSNMSNALKQGGTLLLDYMNVHYTEDHLILKEEKEIDGIIYHITRWMDEKFFYKKILIDVHQSGDQPEFTEQVARFDLHDFNKMFAANNLESKEVFGDYKLTGFDVKNSTRLIMVAKKAA